MSLLLRIKLKALAFQSRELRREENLALAHARYGNRDAEGAREILHGIRTGRLRQESRAANLAYGFLKGRDYWQMEMSCHEAPNFERIEEIALTYAWDDPRIIKQRFACWVSEAKGFLKSNPPMSTVQKTEPQRESIEVIIITDIDLQPLNGGNFGGNLHHALSGRIMHSLLRGALNA